MAGCGLASWSSPKAWRIDAIHLRPDLADTVSLVTVPLAGELFWLATPKDGTILRLNAAGNITDATTADLERAAQRVAGSTGIADEALMIEEDAYYFNRGQDNFVLPVYRIILKDADSTRYYLNPNSGALLQRADADSRWHRWLFGGLHRIDFTAWMRARPARGIIVLTLMLGGLGLTVTGCYLAVRRVRNDLVSLFRLVRDNTNSHSKPDEIRELVREPSWASCRPATMRAINQ